MKNYFFKIAYNGKDFCGWAPQPDSRSIYSEIKNALKFFYKGDIHLHGSGRTDKGVHAIEQTATVELDLEFSCDVLRNRLNKRLPNAILVNSIEIAEDGFHARYNAVQKTYKYIIETAEFNVFENYLKWQVNEKLDVTKMIEASKVLIGEHDFTSYCTNREGERGTHVREIFDITFKENGTEIIIEVTGNGFLKHMVRKLVGTLRMVGNGTINSSDVKEILNAKNRSVGLYRASAAGLYLKKVQY